MLARASEVPEGRLLALALVLLALVPVPMLPSEVVHLVMSFSVITEQQVSAL